MRGSGSNGFLGPRDGGQSPGGGETWAQGWRVRLGGRAGGVGDLTVGLSLPEAIPGGVSARVQDKSVFYDLETVSRKNPSKL